MCTKGLCGPNSLFFDNVFDCCQNPCPPKCCIPPPPRFCRMLSECKSWKPGCALPEGNCGTPSCSNHDCCYPPFPCDPHPCYPKSCRRVPKCDEWPMCPCGRPNYKAVGPLKYCCSNPLPFPPMPQCTCPQVPRLPCYPKLFGNCCRCIPLYPTECYQGCPPVLVRNVCCN